MADGGLTLGAVGFGLAAGFAGWVATEFFAKPFRRGLDLMTEARTRVVIFGNVMARSKSTNPDDSFATHVDLSDAEERRLSSAEASYREMGAQLQAFAKTDRPAAFLLKRLGFDLEDAGRAFIGLSNSVGRYGSMRNNATVHVEKALKINT